MSRGIARLEHERALVDGGQEPPASRRIPRALIPTFGAVFVTIVAVLQWQLWRGGLGVPITYENDASHYHTLTKTIIDFGWYFTNPLLGAPYEQVTYDYPHVYEGILNFFGLRVLAWMSHNPFLVDNLFVLLTFPAVFVTAWYAFRRLRFAPAIACTGAVVYTLLPYHFERRDLHLTLAAYWAVPLACLLLYELLGSNATTESDPRERQSGRLRRVLVSRWFWIPILVGVTGGYAALFFCYLVAVVGIALLVRDREARRLLRPLMCVALTLVVLLASNLPTFIHQWQEGPNDEAAERSLGENDLWGLQLGYLVLPIDNHRIPAFADFKEQLDESVSPLEDPERQSLGLLASIGLVVSLGSLLLAATGARKGGRWGALRRQSGALNLAAILLGTVGGLSTVVGLLGFLQVRAYNRLSIFIAFFSLVALAAAIEAFLAKRTLRRRSTAIAVGLLGVCCFAAFDQTAIIPVHRNEVAAAVASDRHFVQRIERQLGGNGQVFELPLLEAPETAIPDLQLDDFTTEPLYSTDELGKPALFSDSLHWSWGAMKGRPEDLTPSYVERPLESLLPDVDALGFDGIYIDRRGFVDRGREIEARLEAIVGTTQMVSDDGTKSFFDLRPYRRRLPPPSPAAREAALHPLQLDWDDGFGPVKGYGQYYPQLDNVGSTRTIAKEATLRITNTRSETRQLSIHATVQLVGSSAGTLEVRARGVSRRFDLSDRPSPIVIEADISPGTTTMSFRTRQSAAETSNLDPEQRTLLSDVWYEAPFGRS